MTGAKFVTAAGPADWSGELIDTCELEAPNGDEATIDATGEGVVGIGGKDLFLGLEDGDEEAYIELASEFCVMLVPRLGDRER